MGVFFKKLCERVNKGFYTYLYSTKQKMSYYNRLKDDQTSYALAQSKTSRKRIGSFNNKQFEEECKNDSILSSAWKKAREECGSSDLKKIALYCYSIEEPRFYAKLNEALRDFFDGKCSESEFPYLNYYILLEESIQEFGEEFETLYCGISHIKDISKWKVGDNIFANQFESCTLTEIAAKTFAGDGTVFVIKEAPFGICIGKYGKFPEEKEVIIPPNYEFKIIDIKLRENNDSPNFITIKW
jgi:hypothetical protein